jgi:hypothetical protein
MACEPGQTLVKTTDPVVGQNSQTFTTQTDERAELPRWKATLIVRVERSVKSGECVRVHNYHSGARNPLLSIAPHKPAGGRSSVIIHPSKMGILAGALLHSVEHTSKHPAGVNVSWLHSHLNFLSRRSLGRRVCRSSMPGQRRPSGTEITWASCKAVGIPTRVAEACSQSATTRPLDHDGRMCRRNHCFTCKAPSFCPLVRWQDKTRVKIHKHASLICWRQTWRRTASTKRSAYTWILVLPTFVSLGGLSMLFTSDTSPAMSFPFPSPSVFAPALVRLGTFISLPGEKELTYFKIFVRGTSWNR